MWRAATLLVGTVIFSLASSSIINVSTGGQLHAQLMEGGAAQDINVTAPLILDPFLFCHTPATLVNSNVVITPGAASYWDLYSVTADRLATLNFTSCIDLTQKSTLTVQNGFDFYSDAEVSNSDDLFRQYFHIFSPDNTSSVTLQSVNILVNPLSNLTSLATQLALQGATLSTSQDAVTVIDMSNSSWYLKDVHVMLLQNTLLTDGASLQAALEAPANHYLTLTQDLSIDQWSNSTIVVSTFVVITTNGNHVLDTALKQAAITTVRGGAIHVTGNIQFTRCIVLSNRFSEEALLQFVFLNSGPNIVDATEIGGIFTLEKSTVWGDHTSALWSPTFGSAYPLCAQDFHLKYRTTSAAIYVSVAYFLSSEFFECTANTSYTSESFRYITAVVLAYGQGPAGTSGHHAVTLAVAIVLPVVLLSVVACVAVAAVVFCCRRGRHRVELGLGGTMQDIAKETLGDVRLHECLGWGSYGRVYRATWDGREVAIKVGHPVRVTEEQDPLQEAKLTENLQHNNIVQTIRYTHRNIQAKHNTHEVVLIEPWFVMEFCNMGSLAHAITRNVFNHKKTPKMPLLLQTLKDVAAAMAYLHGVGILHGDLTCSNIMLTQDDTDVRGFHTKVVDFGQAQAFSRWSKVSMDVETHGTVTHQPPELLINGTLSPAADVWAFGMVLFQLYTGDPPFKQFTDAQMVYVITTIKHLPTIPAHCPSDLRDLMKNCWLPLEQRPKFPDILQRVTDLVRKYTQ